MASLSGQLAQRNQQIRETVAGGISGVTQAFFAGFEQRQRQQQQQLQNKVIESQLRERDLQIRAANNALDEKIAQQRLADLELERQAIDRPIFEQALGEVQAFRSGGGSFPTIPPMQSELFRERADPLRKELAERSPLAQKQALERATASVRTAADLRAKPQPSAGIQESDEIRRLMTELNATTDPQQREIIKAQLESFLPAGETFQFSSPDGSTFTRVVGKGGQQLTTGTTATVEKDILSSELSLKNIQGAIAAISQNPDALGVQGKVREMLEQLRGQLAPGSKIDTRITDTRQRAALSFQSIAKQLRVDSGNMTRYELGQLERMGEVLDLLEAPQTAVKKLQNLQNLVIGKSLRDLKAIGRPTKDSLLRQIPSSEIIGLVQDGLLTREEAIRWQKLP